MSNHLPSGDISALLSQAGTIICRSGYTMLMDLAALNKKALLIPTPGQTEQEYLASYMVKCGRHISLSQNNISDIWTKLKELDALNPKPFIYNDDINKVMWSLLST